MNDIVTILRDISNETDIDADLAEACRDGAGEIEKLRRRVRFQDSVIRSGNVAALTDAEREAIADGIYLCEGEAGQASENVNANAWAKAAGVLRALLERLK